jgi:hypothetical protein
MGIVQGSTTDPNSLPLSEFAGGSRHQLHQAACARPARREAIKSTFLPDESEDEMAGETATVGPDGDLLGELERIVELERPARNLILVRGSQLRECFPHEGDRSGPLPPLRLQAGFEGLGGWALPAIGLCDRELAESDLVQTERVQKLSPADTVRGGPRSLGQGQDGKILLTESFESVKAVEVGEGSSDDLTVVRCCLLWRSEFLESSRGPEPGPPRGIANREMIQDGTPALERSQKVPGPPSLPAALPQVLGTRTAPRLQGSQANQKRECQLELVVFEHLVKEDLETF